MSTKEILLREIETEKKRLDEMIEKGADYTEVILQSRKVDRLLEDYYRLPDSDH